MTTGLVLGKFAPLHRGHQFLIETALAETDNVIVLIYDAPETTTCPLPVRARWIRRLYPAIDVIEAWDGPTVVGNSPEIEQLHEGYLLHKLIGRNITHFYSSEFYGEHVSRALHAIDRRVDCNRRTVPISATAIRKQLFRHRGFLSPEVYRDLIARVVLMGAPGTGKSTLAARLAEQFHTAWMPEYGRDYWEAYQQNRRLTPEQLVELAEGHREREEQAILKANRFLFVDTNAITTYMFSLYYHGYALPRLVALADEAVRQYDLFLLCEDDIPYEDTWDRSGEAVRSTFQKQIRADLLERRIPFVSVHGDLSERIRIVGRILEGFDKWQSMGRFCLL